MSDNRLPVLLRKLYWPRVAKTVAAGINDCVTVVVMGDLESDEQVEVLNKLNKLEKLCVDNDPEDFNNTEETQIEVFYSVMNWCRYKISKMEDRQEMYSPYDEGNEENDDGG